MSIPSVSTVSSIPPISFPVGYQPDTAKLMFEKEMKPADVAREDILQMAEEKDAPEEDVDRVSELVEAVQDSLDMIKERVTHLRFSVHEQTDQVMVKVTDQASGEVIREIPSQEFLDLAAKFEKMVGLMFDIKI